MNSPQPFQVIIQEQETGCGLASVANLVGRSYAEVKAVANSLGIYAEDQALWSDTDYVRRLLKHFGMRCSEDETPFIDWKALPDLALLATKYHEENGKYFWHWVAFKRIDGKPFVLDSASYLAENLRTDFENIQPKWFIEILSLGNFKCQESQST
ncbi:MAG: hypothetical protein VX875_05715 [Pseudomonadota bacterium]|jgi:hypothetical protein|nr:hypothetical protein [Pseudomonadota bacterium]